MKYVMKQAALGAGLALLAFGGPVSAATDTTKTSAVAFPNDEDSLRTLERAHLRIVRGALRQCTIGKGHARAGSPTPCVISGVMRGLDIADDPVLRAYHAALPMSARYNERRPQAVWRTVAKRHEAGITTPN